MRQHHLLLTAFILGASVGCEKQPPQGVGIEQTIANIGGRAIAEAACATQHNHGHGYEGDVPRRKWERPIRRLRPIRVYLDSYNIVVVMQESPESEKGVYIQNRMSSLVRWSDQEWQFGQILYDPARDDHTPVMTGSLMTYVRNKQAQPPAPAGGVPR